MIYIALAILAYCAYREILWARERKELLQRIQAPERAVAKHDRSERSKDRKPARVIAADNDEAMVQAIEARDRSGD